MYFDPNVDNVCCSVSGWQTIICSGSRSDSVGQGNIPFNLDYDFDAF